MTLRPSRVGVSGPLGRYAAGFRVELVGRGYSSHTTVGPLQLMAHLSRWLEERGWDERDLTSDRVGRFLRDRAAAGYARRLSPRGLAPLLGYLGGLGVLPEQRALAAGSPADALVEEYAGSLVRERGLAPATVRGYRQIAAGFLAGRCADSDVDPLGLAELSAGEVSAFLLAESRRLGAASLNNVATGLRALLRFLEVSGRVSPGLADALPRGPGWCRRSPGRVLEPDEVRRLLAGCDRRQPAGRRDFAMLVLLVRLGLRAGEVAAARLEDVDWRQGEILVRGKGGRCERLPLPVDVGRALADYCHRGGPRRSVERALFLQVRAPYGPVSRDVVSEVVRRACDRAGLARVGAHRLRHTAASALRREGAPLAEIGRVLRHRHQATTAIYATIEAEELRALARAWPGGQV